MGGAVYGFSPPWWPPAPVIPPPIRGAATADHPCDARILTGRGAHCGPVCGSACWRRPGVPRGRVAGRYGRGRRDDRGGADPRTPAAPAHGGQDPGLDHRGRPRRRDRGGGVTSGYALWVQFRGPLVSHGSPWMVSEFHNYPYAFVTPSGALLFHTSASAAAAASYPEPLPEYLAYLGWPLLIVLAVAAVCFGRDAGPAGRGDLRAARAVLPGLVSGTVGGWHYPAAVLPWHWLRAHAGARRSAAGPILDPRRRSGRGPARLRPGPGARAGGAVRRPRLIGLRPPRWRCWPSCPWCPGRCRSPASLRCRPAGRRRCPAAARPRRHVLVIPDLRLGMRWQAETGVPGSMIGGGATSRPRPGGQATSYIDNGGPPRSTSRGSTSGCRADTRRRRRSCATIWPTGGRRQSSLSPPRTRDSRAT